MKTSIKLVTIFAALATLSFQGAFAAQAKSDAWSLKKPKIEKPTLTWNSSVSFDYATNSYKTSADDLENFDDLGQKIRVRDLDLSVDAMMSIFGARLTLEHNSNDLSADADSLREKVRDLYIGVQPMTNLVILYGKTDVPFGADQSQSSENAITKLNEQNERKLVAAVQVTPSFIKQIQSIEVAAFASNPGRDNLDFSQKLDSYSARAIAQLGVVLTQASYMHVKGGENRTSVSGSAGIATEITGPFQVYAELQAVRKSPINGDIDVGTIGASKDLPFGNGKTSVYAEGSRIQPKLGGNGANAGTIGAKYHWNDNVTLNGSVSTHAMSPSGVISTAKDTTVMLSVDVKRASKDKRSEMFVTGAQKDATGQALRDAASKMRAK
jgi:hypothetical protein